jgi:pimeloyl-ACP methyl ester carboxylesterase
MPITAGLHYYHHEGGGLSRPPLVLLHGMVGDQLSWPPEVRRLPDAHVYTLDLPGHGKTEGPGRQSIEDYARSVIDFLDEARLARAVFAGHSMGGAIALSLALDFPDRVCGLGLISTGPRLPVGSSVLENAANPSTFPLALKVLRQLFFGPQASPQLVEATFKRLAANRQTLLHGDLLACDRFDVTTRLDSIRTPTLVACGTDDKLTPVRFSEALAMRIPGAALQLIDGTGHMLMLEQPQRLAKLLSVFLLTIPFRPGE